MEINNVQIPAVEIISTGKILIDNKNPNKMSDANFEALKKNIAKFGFIVPIITNEDYIIADGYHRWKAARELGLTEVSVIKLPLKEVDRRILRQVLNKLKGEHDLELDQQEFKFLLDEGVLEDLEKLLPEIDLSMNIKENEAVEDDFDVAKSVLKPKYDVKLGNVWQLGEHRLMCGDSTKKEDVGILLNEKKINMLLTDPPYGVNYSSKNEFLNKLDKGNRIQESIKNDALSPDEIQKLWINSFTNAFHSMNDGSAYYINAMQGGDLLLLLLLLSIKESGLNLKQSLVWAKNNHVLGRSDYNYKHELILYGWKEGKAHEFYSKFDTTLWEIDKPLKNDLHPTMKPIELLSKAISNSSKEEEHILDLFGGSGSTLIACEQLNRKCFMMEIDPIYCSVIIERWEKLTGQKAEKIN